MMKTYTMDLITRVWMVGLVLLGTICSANNGWAADSIGSIQSMRGVVTVLRDGRNLPVKLGLRLHAGDIVQTADQSTAQLQMDGGDRIFVAYRSRIKLKEYGRFGSGFKASFRAFFGRLLFRVKKGVMSRYEVQTKTAVLGVRGTSWAMNVDQAGTKVAGLTGKVNVRSGGHDVNITQGRFVSAGANGLGKVIDTPASFLASMQQAGIPSNLMDGSTASGAKSGSADYTLKAPADQLTVNLGANQTSASVMFQGWYCVAQSGAANPLVVELDRLYKDIWRGRNGTSVSDAGRAAAARWRDAHLRGAWPFDQFEEGSIRTDMSASSGNRSYQQGPCYTRKELNDIRSAVGQWLGAVASGNVMQGKGIDGSIAQFARGS